jgi:hypothetical protein
MSWYENRMNKNTFFILLLVVVVILVVVLLIAYWNEENNNDNNNSGSDHSTSTSNTDHHSETSSLDTNSKSSEKEHVVVYAVDEKGKTKGFEYNIKSKTETENSVIDGFDNSGNFFETFTIDEEINTNKKKVKNDNLHEEENIKFFELLEIEQEKVVASSDVGESDFSSMSKSTKEKKHISKRNRSKRFRNV